MTTTTMTSTSKPFDAEKLRILAEQLTDRRDDLLAALDIEYTEGNKMVWGVCPIHADADRFNAFNLYSNGTWSCRTRNCEKVFCPSIIGLVRGVLSKRNGWESKGDTLYSFGKTIQWILRFLDQSLDDIQVNRANSEKRKFACQTNIYKQKDVPSTNVTREQIRKRLHIPAQFYLDRKYSASVLDRYDIGVCTTPNKEMTNRVIVPIYDERLNFVGCTGRSIHDECPKCKMFHAADRLGCPDKRDAAYFTKWKHNKEAARYISEDCLYNHWYAKKHIEASNTVIIVESPGNVLRLEDNGIHNSVACFGACLNDGQKRLLDATLCSTVFVIPDNDLGGDSLVDSVYEQCRRTYRLYTIRIDKSKNDIGDASPEDIAYIKTVLCDKNLKYD